MIRKAKSRRASKTAVKSPSNGAAKKNGVARRKRSVLSVREISAFDRQDERHQSCERAWQRLSATEAGDEDRWAPVEEHLLVRSQNREHASRRWKYFSK